MKGAKLIDKIVQVLLVIAGITLGLFPFGINLVKSVFGIIPIVGGIVTWVVYLLLGFAGLWGIRLLFVRR